MATGFNFQPYIQPYVAPPIQEFDRMGEVLNERYETNVANMTELELLANQIQVLPTSQHIKDQMLSEVNATLSELKERGDLEYAAPRVREAARRFATDSNLLQASENFKLAQQYDEELRQARLTGQNMLQFRDYRNEEFIDGQLQRISSDNQQQLNYRERYESYFDGLQPESFSISESGWSQGPGGIYQQTGRAEQTAGIAVDRIQNIVDQNLDSVITSTNEGIQRFRVLTELNGLTTDEAREVIRGEMMGAGLERVFQSSSISTSASPINDPFLAREAQELDVQKRKIDIQKAIASQNFSNTPRYIIAATDLSDDSQGSGLKKAEVWTNKGIKTLVKGAFSGSETERIKGKYELNNILGLLSTSENSKISSTANKYLDLIEKTNTLLGDNADDFLSVALNTNKVFRGSPDRMTSAISNSNASLEELGNLQAEFRQLRSESIGFIFDTNFEDAIEKELKNPITREIGFLSPRYIGEGALDAGESAAWKRATENWDIANFDIVRGDATAAKQLENTNVTIIGPSNDVLGGGYGIGYQIQDSEGRKYVAVPKTTGFERQLETQFLPLVSQFLGADDLVYKNRFKNSVRGNQIKTLEQIAEENQIPLFDDLSNVSIKGNINGGYELHQNNKPFTFKDYYQDLMSSRRKDNSIDGKAIDKIIDDAYNSGVITAEDIRNNMNSSGSPDTRVLLEKIRKSDKPVVFQSQYDIFRAYL